MTNNDHIAIENVPPLVEWHGIIVRSGEHHKQDTDVVREVVLHDDYKLARITDHQAEEVVFDVGAHVGTFAVMWHRKNPSARIVCIEACPENIPVLQANVGSFAAVIHAACTYEPEDVALLNSIKPNGTSTGGSIVVRRSGIIDGSERGEHYLGDLRPLRKITLEEAMHEAGVDHIDVLKLDCEGSEYSIIEHSPSVPGIRFILGEYHCRSRWDELRSRVLSDWDYGTVSTSNDLGAFHARNCNRQPFIPPRPPAEPIPMKIPDIRRHLEHYAAAPLPPPEFRFDCYEDTERHAGEVRLVTNPRYLPPLAALIAALKPRNILTIGALYGTLESCLLQCHGGRDWLGTITICDLDILDYNANRDNGSLIYRNVCGTKFGAFQRTFTLIRGSSMWPDVKQKIAACGPFDLVFVDGEHSHPAVYSDLNLASANLAPGGTILVHDVALFSSGVPAGWTQWATDHPGWHCDAVPDDVFLLGLGFVQKGTLWEA